ncbi:hypothetical protein ACIBG5_18020 [Kribbella sp. NPDC050241]|uniref:hypothetical protein n=1 Tax=Kribbella sp. NPDC050241 TaxID=3364115 RepID=UPI0037B9C092
MGLDANYPAVTMNDPNGHVTVFNEDHLPIGQLGPPPFESASVNVTCRRKAWEDEDWYRLLNAEGWPFPATEAYVAANATHELNPGQPYPIPQCASGCPIKIGQAAGAGALAIGAVAAAAAWRRRRRAPGIA